MTSKPRTLIARMDTHLSILVLLLLVTIVLYYQALDSRFILDDFYNLSDLSLVETNGIAYFIFGGFSGPSGRPISLLSFALQYQDWPANPFAFKLVNLVIHLLNGILIWFICKRLVVYILEDKQYRTLFVVLTTGLWLLHPIQFSTVLYVVQRMTQISAFFVLSGILGYLWAREEYSRNSSQRSLIFMSIFIVLFTLLAILGKENGVLLPLYVIVIEVTLLLNTNRPAAWRWWTGIFLILPVLVLAGYLVAILGDTLQSYHIRPYTLSQRLLTEASILLVYLKDLVMPSYGAFTLYHDDFPVSVNLFTPVYTVFSVTCILLLIFFALYLRRRIPVLSFSLLWFFTGHLLVSTYLNLELYFEHRNYLPSFGIFFCLSWLMINLIKNMKSKMIYMPAITIYCIFILIISAMEARLWAMPAIQINEWARLHPTSIRAMEDLAQLHIRNREYDSAVKVYERINFQQPENFYPVIQKINIENCIQHKHYSQENWGEILEGGKKSRWYGLTLVAALDVLTVRVLKGECTGLDTINLYKLITVLINNDEFLHIRAYLYEFAAILKLADSAHKEALHYIRLSIKNKPRASSYIFEIKLLRLMGRHEEAGNLIEIFSKNAAKDPRKYLAYRNIIKSLQ